MERLRIRPLRTRLPPRPERGTWFAVCILVLLVASLQTPAARGLDYSIAWHTIASGRDTLTATGGGFELTATIGQADAQAPPGLSGGGFSLTGGFEPVTTGSAPPACLPCDMNCDGTINLFDIQPFVDVLGGGGNRCSPCAADANVDGTVNLFDIQPFVDRLAG